MRFLIFFLLLIAAPVMTTHAQNAPDKASPFTAVEWENDEAQVRFEGEYYQFVSIDGYTAQQIYTHCQEEYGDRWKKRFSEDLVEVLLGLGHQPKEVVQLELEQDGTISAHMGIMTEAKRRRVWEHNNKTKEKQSTNAEISRSGDRPQKTKSSTPRNAKEMVAQGYRRFSQEYGSVTYDVSGNQEGTEVVYFDQWGWLEGKTTEVEVSMLGMKTTSKTVAYLDGEWMINYNPDNNYAMRISNPMFNSILENMEEKSMEAIGEKMMEGGMGEKAGTEVILGKTCTIWEVPSLNTRIWMWKGISLKEEAEIMGIKVLKVATAIDFSARPDRNELVVPKDVKGLGSYVWPE